MGVRLGMGWVGSWVHKFTWQWVGLGWICMSVGWVGSWVMKMDPWTTLIYETHRTCSTLDITRHVFLNYNWVGLHRQNVLQGRILTLLMILSCFIALVRFVKPFIKDFIYLFMYVHRLNGDLPCEVLFLLNSPLSLHLFHFASIAPPSRPSQTIQGGAKNGATLSHCKYSENSMIELRGNWWTSAILYAEHSH